MTCHEGRNQRLRIRKRDQVSFYIDRYAFLLLSNFFIWLTPYLIYIEKVNREVFALIGDVPQMAPVEPATQNLAQLVKKERNFKKQVDKWVWNGFGNPARTDELKLHHWTKVQEKDEPYPFARFNRKVEVIKYTPEEYK